MGTFLHTYHGANLMLAASCSTTVYMDDDGHVVFEGRDCDGDEASAVLDVHTMMSRLSGLLDQDNERIEDWESRQS